MAGALVTALPGVVLRGAGPQDMAAVAVVYAHYVRTSVSTFEEVPWTAEAWRRRLGELDAAGLPFLVAEESGEVAGYALAAPYRPKPAYRHTVEDSVYLAPGRAGRGLGAALLGTLVAEAGRAGARQMIAVIADGGDASVALHRRLAFREVGRLEDVGFKLGRWVGTTLMQRGLTAPDAGA